MLEGRHTRYKEKPARRPEARLRDFPHPGVSTPKPGVSVRLCMRNMDGHHFLKETSAEI